MKFASALNREVPVRDFLPYGNHVTENVVKTIGGDYVFCIRVNGAAHQSADPDNINGWHNQFNNFLKNLSSPNIAVWSNIIRRKYGEYPGGKYASGFLRDLNEKYRARMMEHTMMTANISARKATKGTPQ